MPYSKQWNHPAPANDKGAYGGKKRYALPLGVGLLLALVVCFIGAIFLGTSKPRIVQEHRQKPTIPAVSHRDSVEQQSKSVKTVDSQTVSVGSEDDVTGPSSNISDALPQVPELNLPPPPAPKSTFKCASDEIISMTVNTDGQIAPIPFDDNLEKDFMNSLNEEIVIAEDDSDAVKQIKANVIEARNAIKERVRQGMSVRAALEEHRNQMNFDFEMRASAQREAQAIFDSGNHEGAREYVEKMNIVLKHYDLGSIEMPMSREERHNMIIEKTSEKLKEKELKGNSK